MNKITTFILFILCVFQVHARHSEKGTSSLLTDCVPGTATAELYVNNIRANLFNGGDIWWDKNQGSYFLPKHNDDLEYPEVSAIQSTGLWMAGLDPVGNFKMAATGIYNPQLTPPNNELTMNNESDFYPGPINAITGLTNASTCENWDQMFSVTRAEVVCAFKAFEANKKDPNIPFTIDQIPDQVKYWPGKGNPYFNEKFGFDLPTTGQGMAPFFDVDFDGIYNPMKGDIPNIDYSTCESSSSNHAIRRMPDQMTYRIINDSGGPHFISHGDQIQIELHIMSYAYNIEELENVTYHNYKMINRANADIRKFYISNWIDFDLGCSEDDYIGVDPNLSLLYAYNKDAEDGDLGSNCSTGANTFRTEIPIVGLGFYSSPFSPKKKAKDANGNVIIDSITNQPVLLELDWPEQGDTLVEIGMSSAMYLNLEENGESLTKTHYPSFGYQYYNYMKGLWRDGSPMTKGGCGLNPQNPTTKHIFTGEPNDETSWSMCNQCQEQGDMVALVSTGPIEVLQPGAVNNFTQGVVAVLDQEHPCPILDEFKAANEIARSIFNECVGSFLDERRIPTAAGLFDFNIYPNPTDNILNIELDKDIDVSLIEVFNSQGIVSHSYAARVNSVNTEQFSPGVYYIKITDWTGIGKIQKFIKM